MFAVRVRIRCKSGARARNRRRRRENKHYAPPYQTTHRTPNATPHDNTKKTAKTAAHAPPTVADTKRKFLEAYRRPIPPIYNTVVQELLVQQHFIRYGVAYAYNEVYALGFVSVFDQILDSFDAAERAAVFDAYITALGEDPRRYRVRDRWGWLCVRRRRRGV
jgi:hypothetical protein